MNHALTYSLIDHIAAEVPQLTNRVEWMDDDLVLTEITKPFVVVEQMTHENMRLSAGRTDFAETYNWKISVHTTDVQERTRLTDKVISVLRQKHLSFWDTSMDPITETTKTFAADVIRSVPMPLLDGGAEVDRHKTSIEVAVTLHRENGDSQNFTQ